MFLNNGLSFAFIIMTTWFLCGTGNNGKERRKESKKVVPNY